MPEGVASGAPCALAAAREEARAYIALLLAAAATRARAWAREEEACAYVGLLLACAAARHAAAPPLRWVVRPPAPEEGKLGAHQSSRSLAQGDLEHERHGAATRIQKHHRGRRARAAARERKARRAARGHLAGIYQRCVPGWVDPPAEASPRGGRGLLPRKQRTFRINSAPEEIHFSPRPEEHQPLEDEEEDWDDEDDDEDIDSSSDVDEVGGQEAEAWSAAARLSQGRLSESV